MNIFDYIKSKYLRLSKGQRKVAQFILDQPNVVTTNIASEVGRLAGVSESTVIRFCYAIELSGYGELQDRLREYLMLKNTVQNPTVVQKTTSDEVKSVMIEHARQISEAIQKIDSKQLSQALNLLSNARNIYIFGFGEADKLAFRLKEGIENAEVIYDESDIPKISLNATELDVVVVLNNPNFEVQMEHALLIATENKCSTIFIHDVKNHPIKKRCTVDIYLGQPDYMNSFGAFSLIYGLRELVKQYKVTESSVEFA